MHIEAALRVLDQLVAVPGAPVAGRYRLSFSGGSAPVYAVSEDYQELGCDLAVLRRALLTRLPGSVVDHLVRSAGLTGHLLGFLVWNDRPRIAQIAAGTSFSRWVAEDPAVGELFDQIVTNGPGEVVPPGACFVGLARSAADFPDGAVLAAFPRGILIAQSQEGVEALQGRLPATARAMSLSVDFGEGPSWACYWGLQE